MKDVQEYISGLYKNTDIIKKEDYIKNTNTKFFCPVIDTSVARFFEIILKMVKPIKVLELGSSIGYSTTIIATTINKWGGKITTVEMDKRVAGAAEKNFHKYNINDVITLINGDALEVLPKLESKYDMIFLDLFNGLYPDVLQECINLLKHGGVLVADDTLFPVVQQNTLFEQSNKKLHQFNKMVAQSHEMKSILLPFDDGITIAVKN